MLRFWILLPFALLPVLLAQEVWTPWPDTRDPHTQSVLDLRFLNETLAGEHGRIIVQNGRFVREQDGLPLRFWGVNGPSASLTGDDLQHALRALAKRGVNLVRIHTSVFDKQSAEPNPERMDWMVEVAHRARQEGIYTHFSIYFPLWMTPRADLPFLQGYDGKTHPFASLFFNAEYEKVYQNWWRELLTRKGPDGLNLLENPAVFGVELVNEDSFFFWTFTPARINSVQMEEIEKQFFAWAVAKHSSREAALGNWNRQPDKRDNPDLKRFGLTPLYDIFTHKSPRGRDTALFLAQTQRAFYERQVAFLRQLGFKGLITASNWHTANDQIFKPLEHWTYLPGDFIDRHGYFSAKAEGPDAAWSLKPGQTHGDRSALRFDPKSPGDPRDFSHPVADVKINNRPSMLSETTWTRPNRHRGEAPLFYAVYGALQGSDSLVHFAHDGAGWNVKPRFWMQPWTLMAPTQMGQFPAAALLYRLGYVREGDLMASIGLPEAELFALKGTPFVQKGHLDELRLADVGGGTDLQEGEVIDPRIHFVGRTAISMEAHPPPTRLQPLAAFILDAEKRIRSSTGELELDYGKGVLSVNAPRAQALSGNLRAAGKTALGVLVVDAPMDPGHVILVPLDGQPLDRSTRMLLQVMTEERPSGWEEQSEANGRYRITGVGRDPWLFRAPVGRIALQRPDAAALKVTPLDFHGYPSGEPMLGADFSLRPDTVYYVIQP